MILAAMEPALVNVHLSDRRDRSRESPSAAGRRRSALVGVAPGDLRRPVIDGPMMIECSLIAEGYRRADPHPARSADRRLAGR